jgi:uncharacterized protein YlxP (DUF503 family)
VVIGVCSWELALPECRSLKEKRMVVKSLKDRLRSRFSVSVGETDHQDVWTRAEITVAVVATDGRQADSVLDKLDRFVERDGRALILQVRRSHR